MRYAFQATCTATKSCETITGSLCSWGTKGRRLCHAFLFFIFSHYTTQQVYFVFFTTSRCVYSFTTVIVRLLTYSACRWICDRSIWSRRLPISLQEGRLMGGIAHGLVCPLVSMFAYTIDRSTTGENDTENVCFKLLY